MAAFVMFSAAVLLGLFLPFSMANNNVLSGDIMYTGESLIEGDYKFTMQSDCNLVLYDNGKAVWASNTNGLGSGCVLQMQTDGNLVIYNNNNKAVWASNTSGSRGNYILILQRDRNVVIYSCPTWATGTNTANSEGVVIVKRSHSDN